MDSKIEEGPGASYEPSCEVDSSAMLLRLLVSVWPGSDL